MLRRIWLAFLLLIVSVLCVGGQVSEPCPTITVTGPAGVVLPGEDLIFVAQLSGSVPKDLSYQWTINDSDIIDGQGTLELRARFYKGGIAITATITVTGLPTGCKNTASDAFSLCILLRPIQLGELSNPPYRIDRDLLQAITTAMAEREGAQLFVWVYHRGSQDKFLRIKNGLLRQLEETKIDKSRFTIVRSEEGEQRAAFWLVPPGSDDPRP